MASELLLDKDEQTVTQEGQGSSQQQPSPKEGKLLLQDVLDSFGGTTDHPLAARFFDEFSGKQQKLSAFFKKPASSTGTVSTATNLATTATAATFLDNKRPASSQMTEDESVPRKKLFFATSSAPSLPSTPPSPGPSSGSQTRTSTPDNIPKPIIKSTSKPGFSTTTSKKSVTAAKLSGQQTMLSFFGTPAKKLTPSNSNVSQQRYDSGNDNSASQISVTQPPVASASQDSIGSSQELLSLSSSSSSTTAATFSPQDYADWIPGSQEVLPFSINGETTTSKWQTLFTPKTIPKCKFHNQPCTEYTVNKKGPNKGRRFFLCSL
jgi:AP endonuclease-2